MKRRRAPARSARGGTRKAGAGKARARQPASRGKAAAASKPASSIAVANARVLADLREALAHQSATSDVLNVICRSPSDAQPVFEMIAEHAALLCEAQFCFVYRFDGKLMHFVA